ncbi:MAG: ribosome silencing factor [Ruthenibacterium sp.]
MESKDLALKAAGILDEKKATRVKMLKVRELTVLADYFVIASGTSSTHVKSLSEEVEFRLKEQGIVPIRTEGFNTQNWFILDYGTVIVHVFSPEARDFYDLEHLWADGEDVPLNFIEE